MKWDARVCLGVARIISRRRGGSAVRVVDLPDERERLHPAIELIAEDELGEIALEHTQIESFGGQIASGVAAQRLSDLLRQTVRPLPPGRFQLVLDPTTIPMGAEVRVAADALTASLGEVAPTLEFGGPRAQVRHVADMVTDLALVARLYRWPGPDPGVLDCLFAPPRELENLRAERAARAVAGKMQKLLAAAGKDRLSVLVLEDRDIALSNRPLAAQAVRTAFEGEEMPDILFLVEVWNESAEGGLLKELDAWFPAVDQTWWPLDLAEP